ncbi:uncharacterized protein [Montipora capricornis]|uniref:uncharacterized protein n=1 Tax=Montipora capricornis TaxID=246305 RepID=UPI0035F1B931
MPVKTAMQLLLVSLTIFKLARVSTGSWSTALSVGKILLESFTSEDIKETDLTAAEELVRGLTFDKYHEKISTQILIEMKLTDFVTVVSRIGTRHQIPAKTQEAILDGQFVKMNEIRIREFQFEKGATGSVLYGRVVTVKREDSTIDLAYVLFHLEFKLSPRKIEERRRKKFFGIIYGSRTKVRFEERNLSEKEMEHISNFFRIKAVKGFKQEYPALANERTEL